MNDSELHPVKNHIVYTTPNGDVKLEVFIHDKTLWIKHKMIAELFEVKKHNTI